MAMNPMQRKARISFLLGVLATLVITGIVIGYLFWQLNEYKKKEAAIVYKTVCVLSDDVKSGDVLNGKVTTKSIDTTLLSGNAISSTDEITDKIMKQKTDYIADEIASYKEYKSKVDLKAGTILTDSLIFTEETAGSADLRLQEYNMIILPSELTEGDYVDIRLRLPSGEDYIVISKKHVEKADDNTIWLKVGEDEILVMSNAIVEAYIMNGSLLYATTYSDAGMQAAATPTYVARKTTIDLMNTNPNLTNIARASLEARYRIEGVAGQRKNIDQSLAEYDEDAITNIEQKLEEEIVKQQTARQAFIESLGV